MRILSQQEYEPCSTETDEEEGGDREYVELFRSKYTSYSPK